VTSGEQQPATPAAADERQAAPTAVRACERCGAVCGLDQEWCLNCGVRLTPMSQRLPGLRTTGVAVVLGVLLAGGAAAASYAALKGDARSAANAPAATSGTPVAQAPPTVTDPLPPSVTTAPPATTTPKATATTPKASGSTSSAEPESDEDATGDAGASTGGSGGGTTSTPKTTTPSAISGDGGTSSDVGRTSGALQAVTFAKGQGSLYDPDGIVADRGDEGAAIDGSKSTSWKATLAAGQVGGFGYVLDFDRATALRRLRIYSPTDGLVVKILGTTKTELPPDALDSGWDALATETTLKGASKGKGISLREVGGRNRSYKHVLVWITTAPGTPASAQIDELVAYR